MASVNPTTHAVYGGSSAVQRRTGRGLVVLLWILVMVPLAWGIMMTLQEVRKGF
jgi:hypothetical protein